MRITTIFVLLLALPATLPAQHPPEKALPILESGYIGLSAGLHFLPGDQQALTVGQNRTLRFWDVNDGRLLKTLYLPIGRGGDGKPLVSALSSDGKNLAVGGVGYLEKGERDSSVLLIDLEKERVQQRLAGPIGTVRSVSISANGKRVAAMSEDGTTAHVWETGQAKAAFTVPWPKNTFGPNSRVRLSPDGKFLLFSAYGHGFKIIEVDNGKVRHEFKQPKAFVSCNAWAPNGKLIATGHYDGLRIWTWNGAQLEEKKLLPDYRWIAGAAEQL